MSNWQSFKKKHVLLMNAAFTVAIPAAVWLIMELLNLAFCGVHTLNSTVDYTTLMRNLVTSFCFALGLNCNLPVGRMDTSTGSQMYLACIIGGNIALSLNLGGIGVLVFSMLFGMLAGGFVGFLFINIDPGSCFLSQFFVSLSDCRNAFQPNHEQEIFEPVLFANIRSLKNLLILTSVPKHNALCRRHNGKPISVPPSESGYSLSIPSNDQRLDRTVLERVSWQNLLTVTKHCNPCFPAVCTSIKHQIMIAVLYSIYFCRLQRFYTDDLIEIFNTLHIGKAHLVPRFQIFQVSKVFFIIVGGNHQIVGSGRTKLTARCNF